MPSLREMVYVGVSAGSMAATTIIGETYPTPPKGSVETLSAKKIVFPHPRETSTRCW